MATGRDIALGPSALRHTPQTPRRAEGSPLCCYSAVTALGVSRGQLPGFARDVFRISAEGLVGYGAGGHGARRGPGEGGGRCLGNLLAQVADPLLLLLLGQCQQEHVACRGDVVVHCGGHT